MPADEMDDDTLLGYFLTHCLTPRALFHRDHYLRLRELAGDPYGNPEGLIEFFAVWPPEAGDLVAKARVRMNEPLPAPSPKGWDEDPLSCP